MVLDRTRSTERGLSSSGRPVPCQGTEGSCVQPQRPTPESDSKDSEMIYDFCETNVIGRNKVRRRKVNERTCVRERTVFDLRKIQILAVRGMLGAGRQGCAAVQRGAHAALSAGFRLNRHNECMIEARMPVKS